MKSKIVKYIMYLVQWTWGILQNLLGLFLMLRIQEKNVFTFHGALVVDYEADNFLKHMGTFTLGMFIFYNNANPAKKQNLLSHEYGHTIQSLIYGPLYLPIVGTFSYRWSKEYWKNQETYNSKNVFYCDRYPEKQANYWGEKFTGHQRILD